MDRRRSRLLLCAGEALTGPDRIPGPLNVYQTSEYSIGSTELAGGLSNDQPPAANTRLLNQFPPDVREYVSAFYWGHEHSTSIFDRYVDLPLEPCEPAEARVSSRRPAVCRSTSRAGGALATAASPSPRTSTSTP